MIRNVFSIVDVLRAERKDGAGGREVRIYATRYFKEGYHGVFDKTSLIRLCMTIYLVHWWPRRSF